MSICTMEDLRTYDLTNVTVEDTISQDIKK